MVQAWRKSGAKVAQKWLKSGKIEIKIKLVMCKRGASVARAWRERGAGVAQA